jgi:hypothetical protein
VQLLSDSESRIRASNTLTDQDNVSTTLSKNYEVGKVMNVDKGIERCLRQTQVSEIK